MDDRNQQIYEMEREAYFQRLKLALISAISTGELDSVLRGFADEYAEIKVERETLAIKINQLIAQITLHLDLSLADYYRIKDRRTEISKQLNEIATNGDLPYPAVIWVNMTKELDALFLKETNTLHNTAKSEHPDLLIDAMPHLNQIVARRTLTSWWDARNLVTSLAIGHSDDPKMICYQIMRELRTFGKAEMDTVNRLKPDWLVENISDRLGKSHATLYTAINHAYKFKTEKMRLLEDEGEELRQLSFAESIHMSEDNLRLYIGYLTKIEEKSRDVSDFLRQAIDDMLSAEQEFVAVLSDGK